MRIWVPGGKKERFQHDISGSLLPPVSGTKQLVHWEANSTFLLLFYCTEWPKALLGRFVVCPSLESLLFMLPFCEQDVYLPRKPVACLFGKGVLGITPAQPAAPGPMVMPDLRGLQDPIALCD